MKKLIVLTSLIIFVLSATGLAYKKEGVKMPEFAVKSPAFKNNGHIPKKYAGDGDNISPPLKFENIPKGTKTLVLIVDDPDAPMGNFNHWVVFNIPAKTKEFKEGKVPAGSVVGKNSAGKISYSGPNPPPGKPHHYVFKLYALDGALLLSGGATKGQVEETIGGHVLAHCILAGMYQR